MQNRFGLLDTDAIFYFPFHLPKIPKILLYRISSLSDLTLQITVKGLTTPLSCWVQVGVCLCRYSVACALSPAGLIPWFSKTEGNTYSTLLHHPFIFKGKTNASSRGSSSLLALVPFDDFYGFFSLQLDLHQPSIPFHVVGGGRRHDACLNRSDRK